MDADRLGGQRGNQEEKARDKSRSRKRLHDLKESLRAGRSQGNSSVTEPESGKNRRPCEIGNCFDKTPSTVSYSRDPKFPVMKRSVLFAAVFAGFISVPGAVVAAEPEAPAEAPVHPIRPMLWKIDRGEAPPSYLFGTIHVSDPGVVNLHPAAQKAFEAAATVHTEVSMDPAVQLMAAMGMLRKDGKNLKQSIGPELAARLDEEIEALMPGFDSTPFQLMKTWVLPITLPTMKEQLSGAKPLDLVLWERAKAAKKKTRGIQTTAEQTKSLDALTEAEQIDYLDASLKAMAKAREEGKDMIGSIVEIYRKGDPDALATWFEEEDRRARELVKGTPSEALMDKVLKGVLNDRDVVMAEYVKKTLEKDKESTHFFAVGTAHLALKGSVPDMLREAGYKVTLVTE